MKFPVSMTMETKQHGEISSAKNNELFWCNFQEIFDLKEILTQDFQIDVFRGNIIKNLKELGRNFEGKVGVQKMEEKK